MASQSTLDVWASSTPITKPKSKKKKKAKVDTSPESTPILTKSTKRNHSELSTSASDNSALESCNTSTMPDATSESTMSEKLDEIIKKLSQHDTALSKLNKLDTIELKLNEMSNRISEIEEKAEKNKTEISEIKTSLDFAYSEIDEIKKETTNIHSEIQEMKTNINTCKTSNRAIETELLQNQAKMLSDEITDLKGYSQRHNLLFDGIKEEPNENCKMTINNIVGEYMDLPDAYRVIDKAHRLGAKRPGKPRSIVVRFITHSAKETTYSRLFMLRGTGLGVRPHLPEKTEREHRLISNILPLAKQQDSNANITAQSKLFYKGKLYDSVSVRNSAIPTHKVHQRETTTTICFQGHLSPLSNFYSTTIEIDNNLYTSTEQYYQAEKAKRHSDPRSLARIMLTNDPYDIKKISRQIKPNPSISQEAEESANHDAMVKCVTAKFQDPSLRRFLIETGAKRLAEHSKYDTFWGTGYSLFDKDSLNFDSTRGQNRLGQILEQVRASIQ